jgi:PIN domain nuclease of toxin-antitoxin system
VSAAADGSLLDTNAVLWLLDGGQQAQAERLAIVSLDPVLADYGVEVIW